MIVVRPFLGAAVNRWGHMAVLKYSLLLGGPPVILLGVFSSMPWLVLASVLSGATIGLAMPLTMILIAELVSPETRGLALSLRSAGNRLGQMVSPLLLGILAGSTGPAATLWLSGGILSAGVWLTRSRTD